jgi:rubrerythrin
MDSASKSISEALFQAIKAEGDGYHFYLMAARSTKDEQGREVFEMLAREELDHQRFLRTQHRSVLETGKPDTQAKLGPRAALSGESPIFSAALKERVKDAHFEMSALSIAIQLEQGAMEYYKRAAEQSVDATVKAFFEELAEWERGHYGALLQQQSLLKRDYWSSGGFSPF